MFLYETRGVKDKIFKGVARREEGERDAKARGKENNEDDGALGRFYARDLHTIGRFELER